MIDSRDDKLLSVVLDRGKESLVKERRSTGVLARGMRLPMAGAEHFGYALKLLVNFKRQYGRTRPFFHLTPLDF
jgi:hypothetical protein